MCRTLQGVGGGGGGGRSWSANIDLNFSQIHLKGFYLLLNPNWAKPTHGGVKLHICGGSIKNANVQRGQCQKNWPPGGAFFPMF